MWKRDVEAPVKRVDQIEHRLKIPDAETKQTI